VPIEVPECCQYGHLARVDLTGTRRVGGNGLKITATLVFGRTSGSKLCHGPQRAATTELSVLAHSLDFSGLTNDPALESPSFQDRKGTTLSAMWKPSQNAPINSNPTPEPPRPTAPVQAFEATSRPAAAPSDQATIGKGLFIKGEISGSESLYIDGKVEGSVNLPGNRVTVGRNGQVAASINAREIVVLGKVRGNVTATDRVDIRAEGSLSGDVAAARISIEDGAFFKGGIDIRKPETKPATPPSAPAAPEAARPVQ
jgi:cytoskeletal protein CcmA (bactofilin family)